jgi:hypothetical protein
VNTNSKAFNDKLQATISKMAKIAEVKNYSANKIAADVEVKFKAFVQGVRYGGFISDNFIKTRYPEGVCTSEIKNEINKKVTELIKSDEFYLDDSE